MKKTFFLFKLVFLFCSHILFAQQSVNVNDYLEINGVKHAVMIKGNDISKPVLLYLHGHGMPSMLFAYMSYTENSRIYDEFIVVHYDQRGAGKSYSKDIQPESMNIDQFVDDAHEIVKYLKKTFQKEKIYLLAESWGSIIGMNLIKKYPGNFFALIAEGVTARYWAAIQSGKEYALEKAKAENNRKAIRQINKHKGVTRNDTNGKLSKAVSTINKWMDYYKAQEFEGQDLFGLFKEAIKNSPEYDGLGNKTKVLKGLKFTMLTTVDDLIDYNLFDDIKKVEVPVYFMMGKHDILEPFASEYYEILESPKKGYYFFENSGHVPSADEPLRFESIVFEKIFTKL
jgi:proline iminopeptidase